MKEKTQPYVGGKGQLFTVDYVPMVPLLSGKPTFKSAISLFYPRLRLASFVPMGLHSRVTSLEQLSLAEFSGEKARPKIYVNGHANVLGI